MNVVDASVLVEYLTEGELVDVAREVIGREPWVWAPALVDAEVGHALRRQVPRGNQRSQGGRRPRRSLRNASAESPAPALVGRAWQLRDNVSFYDGLYVALAEAVGSPLVTRDARLARTPGLRTEVELIGG